MRSHAIHAAGSILRVRYLHSSSADPLLLALGRPNREQVLTTRSPVATTLQMLELANGQTLSKLLQKGAEELLAEADRRMYLEKQQQPWRKNRRSQPRLVCRVTVTLQPEGSTVPILGNLSNISLTGCYVETGALLQSGTRVRVFFSSDDNSLQNEGTVARSNPGSGVGIQFSDTEDRNKMHRILAHVESATKFYDRELGYIARMVAH